MILSSTYPVVGNGLGGLPDAIEATVTHEINGQYEFFMRYPVTGLHYEDLQSGRIILAEPDDLTDAQPFRIYRITKPLNGIVSVYARHLCYDMQGIIVEPFTTDSLTNAFLTIPTKCTPASPITIQTTRTVASGMSISEPRPLWKLIGGQSGSILDVYGGEWDFDKDVAKLVTQLGTDRGVSIRYGKNMTEMEQDATIESSYSGVYPYWYDEESNTLVTLPEKYVTVAGAVVSDRVMILDCSSDFENAPTEAELRARANAYITANSVGNVKASWKISFVDTKDLPFDKVMLGDVLHVYYERLDVNATARAVKTEYDVLSGRYKSITVGRVKQNLASIIVDNQEKTEEGFKEIKSDLETAVDDATDFIRNGRGYMRFIYNSSNELVEIVSLDDPDISQATNVWRWNNGGFGFSSTGYSGTYGLALTQSGHIVADFVDTGTLTANVIRAGILQDALGLNSWNLDTGVLSITNGKIVTTHNRTFAYTDYSSTDLDAIVAIVNAGTWTDEELAKYDFNLDGQITLADRVKLNNMLTNQEDLTVSIKTEIDPSKTDRPICLYDNNGNPTSYISPNAIGAFSGMFGKRISVGDSYLTSAGYFELKNSSSPEYMRAFADSGIEFYDSNGTKTATYPANPTRFLKDNGLSANSLYRSGYELYSSSGSASYTLTSDHTYLVTCMQRNSTSTSNDAVWVVSTHSSNSNIVALKSSSSTTATINGVTLSISRGAAYMRVSWICLA